MNMRFARLGSFVVMLGLSAGAAVAVAQEPAPEEFKQVELTDQTVTAFIAAQKDFAPLANKLAEAGETPDAALTKELDDIAKKHGFASFIEFEDVGANITVVLDGLDRSTGNFTDPLEKMKKELEDIKADETIPPEDKKLAVDDLTKEIEISKPLQYKGNIDVVKKHVAEIEALIPEEAGESGPDEEGPPAP